jgi:hypothetical protein
MSGHAEERDEADVPGGCPAGQAYVPAGHGRVVA